MPANQDAYDEMIATYETTQEKDSTAQFHASVILQAGRSI